MSELHAGRQVRHLGRDHVLIEPERMVVRSPLDMLDWKVQPYRKPVILHDGRRWELVSKTPGVRDTVRYDLVPWPEDRTDVPGLEIVYDEDYVAARDAEREREDRADRANFVIGVLQPLVGFLPQRLKERWQLEYGVGAVPATRLSLHLEWALILLGGAAITIFAFAGLFGGASPVPVGLMLVGLFLMLPDLIFRHAALLEEPPRPLGFWEWAADPWRKRAGAAGVDPETPEAQHDEVSRDAPPPREPR